MSVSTPASSAPTSEVQPPVASPALGELEDVARVFRQILTRSSPSGSTAVCAKRVLLNQAG